MSSFRSPAAQAHWAAIKMGWHGHSRDETRYERGTSSSQGTDNTRESALRQLAKYLRETRQGDLRSVKESQVREYLEKRSVEVGQKQLDKDRQAAQAWLSHRSGMNVDISRKEFTSQKDESGNLANQSRIYTDEQLDRIQSRMTERNNLAVQICRETGTRAHELSTIARPDEQTPHERAWSTSIFSGKKEDEVSYTVKGKGGLVREVRMSKETSDRLESRRRDNPQTVKDRGINYQSRYNVGKGQALSQAFTRASQREVGWSAGLHGIRHVYAQDRLDKLQENGHEYKEAKTTVSQEVGHFRPQTTDAYLR